MHRAASTDCSHTSCNLPPTFWFLSPSALPLCDIPSGCCSFTGPWTVTCSSLRMLRWVAAFYRPLRLVLLLVSFPRSRSPVSAFGGYCNARTSWFHCVLLCALLGLVSLPCVGWLCARLLWCLRSSQFPALSSSAGLLVCGAGGAACRSLPPIAAVGLSHFQLGGTRGTGHFCTCLQIYKLTCHRCLLGLF